MPRKSSLTMTLTEKLCSFIVKVESGCWEYSGTILTNGYGRLLYDGQIYSPHRLSYELNIGPIPDGLFVLHKCDNRCCVNPDHLFVGTLKDNADDMRAKGRDAYGENFGENNGQAKLTEDQVRQIRKLLDEDVYSQREIGDLFGVTRGAIKMIKLRQTWRHI